MALTQRLLPYPHWEFAAPGGDQLLRLVPERGGLVTGWCCQGQEVLYFDQERFRDPTLSVRGGIPVLFPICGGLPAERSRLPQHGFARDCPWSLALLPDDHGVLLQLEDDARTRSLYPHRFHLSIAYRLTAASLQIVVRVCNRGTTAMPYSIGLHPYFAVSALAGARLTGLPDCCLDQVSNTSTATADLLRVMADGIDLLAEPSEAVTLHDPQAGRSLRLESGSPLDLVVVWTDPPRPMVCLEPWTAPRGALLSGDRLLTLAPGEQQELTCRYVLEAG